MTKLISAQLFQVQPGSAEPIYRQLIAQVRRLHAAGQLQAGDILPSVREVALYFAVNPMTVSKAYSALEQEGLLERRRGIGMAISGQNATAQTTMPRLAMLRPSLQRVVEEARQLDLDTQEVLSELSKLFDEGN